jgi:argininosuccinate lyase
MENKMWEGMIEKNTDKEIEKFTSSIGIDRKLYLYDITGTAAHAAGLYKIGIIKKNELEKVFYGLKKLKGSLESDKVNLSVYEDIHSLIEKELGKIIGDTAMKIHTGRSRNDQIVLDEKLFLKQILVNTLNEIITLQKSILKLADNSLDIIIPSYTHMQGAQPVLLSHYLMSFFYKFDRDISDLFYDFEKHDCLPLGAAACTGSGYKLDRKLLKELLRFKELEPNSMDVVGNRDFIIDFVFSCSKIMLHLSRFCEDLIIYNTGEFSFIEIDDSFCTGSSIMPQKKNPDVLELIRAKTALVIGNLLQLMLVLKGLPSTYNRDLQEDKKILFSAYEETLSSIKVFSRLIGKLKFNKSEIKKIIEKSFLEATDIADYLVKKGESFRKAHNTVGKIIRRCIDKKILFRDMKLEELKDFSEYFDDDVFKYTDADSCISHKEVDCGTAKNQVVLSIISAKKKINKYQEKSDQFHKRIPSFEEVVKYIEGK